MANNNPLGNMIVRLDIDDTSFKNGLASAKSSTKYWMSEMKASLNVLDRTSSQVDKLKVKQDGLTKIIETQRKEVEELTKRYKNSYDENGNASDKTADYAREVNNAVAKLSSLEKQLDGVNTQLKIHSSKVVDVGKTMERQATKINNFGEAFSKMGSKLTKAFTLPLTGAVGASVKAAADWEDAFAGVKKTVDEVVDKNGKVVYSYAKIEKGLRDLAKETPNSVESLAELAESAGQLGIHTENVLGFTEVMSKLNVATDIAGEEGAQSIARFANVTKMSQKDFDRLGSTITYLGNNSAATENEILELSMRLAGAGAQVGMSQSDILALAASLKSVGIEAEAGGSAFTKVLSQMQLSVETNSEKLAEFANVAGVTSEEFAKKFKNKPVEALDMFIKGLSNMDERGISAIKVLDDMGIKEARLRDNLLRSANASGTLTKYVKESSEAWQENTALTEEADVKYGTLKSQMDKFKNNIKDIGINLGAPFMAAVNDMMLATEPFVNKISELSKKFVELPKSTQQNIVKFTGLAIAMGPLLKITGGLFKSFASLHGGIGKIISKFGIFAVKSTGLKAALSGVVTAMAPLAVPTLIVGGIVAIGVAFYQAYKHIDSFKNIVDKAAETVKNFSINIYQTYLKPALEEITNAINMFATQLKDFWDQYGTQFLEALRNFFSIIMAIVSPALTVLKLLFSAAFDALKIIVSTAWESIRIVFKTFFGIFISLTKNLWDTMKGIFSGAFKIIGGLLKVFTGVFTGDWKLMWTGLQDIAKGAWNVIATGIEGFANAVLSVIGGLANGMKSGIVGAINGVIKAVNWVLDKFGQKEIEPFTVKDVKISKVKLPKFESGTMGLPVDLVGVVNDQKGSNYQEMIIPPNGKPFIPSGRNVTLPMQKGTQILPASMTKFLVDGMPHFKKGFFGKTKNIVGNIWGKVKDFTGDVLDYIEKPGELVKLAINKFTHVPDLPSFWGQGAVGTVKYLGGKAKDYVKTKMDEFVSTFNFSGDDSVGSNGVYTYLMDIANKLMSKYGMIFTSGYRAGDPYDHGKGLAVDIALPGVSGSPIYTKAANEAIAMPGVKYVITNGMWKHKGKPWVPWPDGDHYDHVHISGEKPKGDAIAQLGGGGAVNRWSPVIQRAAALMGQSLSGGELNGILAQIQRESGGNDKIIQSSAVWDINTASGNPARGLLQYIPQTFRAYMVRGYENIMNGFHQLMAFFNNSNWKRDLPYGRSGWGPTGVRVKGYANGGIVDKHQLAQIAEGNKPEMVIPLTKKSRAVSLINKAKEIVGMNDGQVVVNNDYSSLESKLDKLIGIVYGLATADNTTVLNIDSRTVAKAIHKPVSEYQKRDKNRRALLWEDRA